MLIGHDHAVGWFDAGHCRACAHAAGLLDHYDRVQREEARLRHAREWALTAAGGPVGRCWSAPSGWRWPWSPC